MRRQPTMRIYTYLDIVRDGKEIEVRVTATYHKESAATHWKVNGDPGDPIQEAYVDNIQCQKGYELTQEEYEAVEKKMMDCPIED